MFGSGVGIQEITALFQSYKIQVVAKENPLKYLHSVPSLVGKLGRWLVLLTEFDIEYLTSKVIKG